MTLFASQSKRRGTVAAGMLASSQAPGPQTNLKPQETPHSHQVPWTAQIEPTLDLFITAVMHSYVVYSLILYKGLVAPVRRLEHMLQQQQP